MTPEGKMLSSSRSLLPEADWLGIARKMQPWKIIAQMEEVIFGDVHLLGHQYQQQHTIVNAYMQELTSRAVAL